MSNELKQVIQDLINDRPEQAQATIHAYMVGKIQEVAGLNEAKTDDQLTPKQKKELTEGTDNYVAYFAEEGFDAETMSSFSDKASATTEFKRLKKELGGSDQVEFMKTAQDGSFIVGYSDHRQRVNDVTFIGTGTKAQLKSKVSDFLDDIGFGEQSDIDYFKL